MAPSTHLMLTSLENEHHLIVHTSEHLQQVMHLINTNPEKLAYSRVSLYVDQSLLQTQAYQTLLAALNHTALQKLELVFPLDELKTSPADLAALADEYVAERVNYPVNICYEQDAAITPFNNPAFDAFHAKIIARVQQHNQMTRFGVSALQPVVIDEQVLVEDALPPASAADKKIALKSLITQASKPVENVDQYIMLEIQHNEVEQLEQVQEEVLDVALQEQEQEQGLFDGQLVDFTLFSDKPYRTLLRSENLLNVFRSELFGNMPKAITFLSHEAAMKIAAHADAFVTFNADNLPLHFMLKKTRRGELVLDYDPDADARITNVFTPKEIRHYEATEQIYAQVDLPESMRVLAEKYAIDIASGQLDNLWVRYGDAGVSAFLAALGEPGKVSEFIIAHYLRRFPHWDRLLDDPHFLDSLTRIHQYEPAKLAFLIEFLTQNTDNAQYNLTDILNGFDVFWSEWSTLAQKHHFDAYNIAGKCTCPPAGNPLVFMERLLTILKNSRDLLEQLACLDGLSLDNYAAYYASKYEDFHIVSADMGLRYDPVKQDAIAFNPDASVYRVDIAQLVEYCAAKAESKHDEYFPTREQVLAKKERYFLTTANRLKTIESKTKLTKEEIFEEIAQKWKLIPYEGQEIEPLVLYRFSKYERGDVNSYYFERIQLRKPLPRDEILRERIPYAQLIERTYRFVGQQPDGISLPVYAAGVKKFLNGFFIDVDNTILTSLFFVAHERYSSTVDLYSLLDAIYRMESHSQVVIANNRSLLKLFQQDIRLNDQEGYAISQRVGMLNSSETDHLDKAHYIQKLFVHLQNNKQGTLKAIRHLIKDLRSEWPFVYALDAAEYFMQNASIAGFYHADLLLFSLLINTEDVYWNGDCDSKAHQYMQRVNEYLLKAATGTQPNNLDYAIKALVQSSQYFNFTKFIAACQEIDTLEVFDYKAVERILAKHQFTLKAGVPEVFSRDSGAVKGTIIQLLLALEMAEGDDISLTPLTDASSSRMSNVNYRIQAYAELEQKRAEKQRMPANEREWMNDINKEIRVLEKAIAGTTLDGLRAEQEELQHKHEKYLDMLAKSRELSQLSMKALQNRLNAAWETKGMMLSISAKAILYPVLQQLKQVVIEEEFSTLGKSALAVHLVDNIPALTSFKEADNFEKIDRIANEAAALANQFHQLMQRNYFNANAQELTQIFSTIDYATYDYETLFVLLDMLIGMQERDYADILRNYLHVSSHYTAEEKIALIGAIRTLHNHYFPSAYIAKLVTLLAAVGDVNERGVLLHNAITVFARDEDDPLLRWILKTDSVPVPLLVTICTMTKSITTNRAAVQRWFGMMDVTMLKRCLDTLTGYPDESVYKIIEIVAMSYTATPTVLLQKNPVNYQQFITMLGKLSKENLDTLYTKLSQTNIAITCLHEGLQRRNPEQPFDEFLTTFEKAPFGARDFTEQFDIEQAERVVNNCMDLNNQSVYSYTYRKHMMEAFLFINRAGYDLPVYNNKPAKELTNAEIRQLFHAIKSDEFKHLDPFQRRLYALGLMREATYRATGQFLYSTQMLALIDCIMHQGDVISNIDTGQGKSVIDTIKATLLWLESTRVDLTTASLIDAKRDLGIYASFWSLLDVPFAATLISSDSPFDAYAMQGINVSTIAQLALFYSKAKAEQVDLESDKVSAVLNESDHTTLDESRTVYRFAATGGAELIGAGKEWIYTAINQFVNTPYFTACTTTEAQDIAALKKYVLAQAKQQNKSARFIEKFSDKKWLMLLESALIVNYRLRENFDYVLTEKAQAKRINGVMCQTRSAKLIMKNGKISNDTQYGNGMQQLLYAKLNAKHGANSFVIEPESRTIISSNNKNMIDYYRSKKGFIWGSSGTVGFSKEIDQQYQKYGFEFSRIEPHQRNITEVYAPVISEDEAAQFAHISKLLQPGQISWSYSAPALVIFKDIETATRFHAYLKARFNHQAMQLFTGLGDEEQAVLDAANSGMITITTPALGRNTDIHYDKSVGMTVIETFVATSREDRQKAGRTGRQGSPGTVYYSLNQADLGGKTPSEIRAMLEEKAEVERQFNEELYDLLGYLLQHVGQADKAFFKDKWSVFSAEVEAKYREEKLNKTYQRDRFLQEIAMQFNALSDKPIAVEQLIKAMHQRYEIAEKTTPHNKPVTIADCISPDIIAYHFVNPVMPEQGAPYLKEEVKGKLTALFAAINTRNYVQLNNEYIAYLNMSAASAAVIKEAHREFLSEYLTAEITASKNTPFYQRWLSNQGHLNSNFASANYLMLFKAMMDTCSEDTVEVEMKTCVITLLEEYLQHSWFINTAKRNAANALITAIKQTETTEQLVELLSNGMLTEIQKDREINQSSFWRRIKPLHAFGESRLQNTLDRALTLTSVIASQCIKPQLIQQLEDDSISTDTTTAKIATRSLQSALNHYSLHQPVKGMTGRDKPEADAPEPGI